MKSFYAFGDSIVYGHTAPDKSFSNIIADDYGMKLNMYAVNGASIIALDSEKKEAAGEGTKGNYIIRQIEAADEETPDVIIFNGGTNDAYGASDKKAFNPECGHINVFEHLGKMQGRDAKSFDNSTFYGGFEEIVYTMKTKWPNTPIIYIATHKSGGRKWEVQCRLRDIALEICEEWGIEVLDVFKTMPIDTRDEKQMAKYIINGAGSHPNELCCRSFYVPALIKKFSEVFGDNTVFIPKNIGNTVDIAVFAGQSNMSGRGDFFDSDSADFNCGFEYKSVSIPKALVNITEPFGLGEDREGKITDAKPDFKSKRNGSMVSAAANAYYKNTGRQLVAISASKGGSNTVEWLENLIDDAVERLDNTKKFLSDNNITISRIFVVWCQGESDGDVKRTADDFTENTKKLFEKFKQHGAKKCFIVQTGHFNYIVYPKGANGVNGEEWDNNYNVIRKTQEELCRSNEDFELVGSFDSYISYMKDTFHYKQEAYNMVGKEVGKNIAKFYNK